jgi:hypothetical protein
VACHDETLQELWRFNVGTPLAIEFEGLVIAFRNVERDRTLSRVRR